MLLSDVPAEDSPIHLLLIGETKLGKSTYIAQAVKDGYLVIYVDADNGISALRRHLTHEEQTNVIYIGTEHPYGVVYGLLTKGVFRWNLTKDAEYSSGVAAPTDKMIQIIPAKIPKQILLCVDSWTSTSLESMGVSAKENSATLEDMGQSQQAIYGDANMKLTLLCAVIQHAPFNVAVLAHGTMYERFERPPGRFGDVKQKDMILKETIKIPLSSSRPHGFNMGKYFNEIGWIELDRADRRMLDYRVQFGRVGGGTKNNIDTIENYSFAKTFGPVPPKPALTPDWIKHMTSEEFVAETRGPATTTPTQKPAGASAAGVLKTAPAQPVVSAMQKKPTSTLLKK